MLSIAEAEVEVNLRPTVSRPVCLGARRPSGTHDQSFSLLQISFRQLRVCYCLVPSLTRGRVCNLLVQLLLGLARAVTLGSKSRRTHCHILLFYLRLPQPGGPGPNTYIPQEQGGPAIPPGTGSPCVASYHSQGTGDHRGGLLNPCSLPKIRRNGFVSLCCTHTGSTVETNGLCSQCYIIA
jgi:hypothetical protein